MILLHRRRLRRRIFLLSIMVFLLGGTNLLADNYFRADILIDRNIQGNMLDIALADESQIAVFAAVDNKAVVIKANKPGHYSLPNIDQLSPGQRLSLFISASESSPQKAKISINSDTFKADFEPPLILLDGLLMNITDSLTIGTAGAQDTHSVGFDLTTARIGARGEVWINFSTGFDIGGITWAEYKDTDISNDGDQQAIDSIDVVAQTVKFILDDGDDADTGRITIKFALVNNDTIAGNYHVTVMTVDSLQNIVNNPVASLPFNITPAPLDHITLSPDGPINIPSDSLVMFSAAGFDRYGNAKTGLTYTWNVTVDSCGTIIDGTFRALKVGSCKVIAASGGISDTSGLLTVTPGPIGRFTISGTPSAQTAGIPFAAPIVVAAYDVNDNLKTNYLGQIYFISNDSLATLPYTQASKYQFTAGDSGRHNFPGAGFVLRRSGNRTISVTDSIRTTSSSAIAVSPSIIDSLYVSAGTPQTAGVSFNLSVSAYDVFGNPANGVATISASYGGGLSPDGVPPVYSNVNVTNGTGQAPQVLTNAVNTILRAVAGSAEATTDTITVSPGIVGRFQASGYPSSVVAGQSFPSPANDILVRVYDVYGNLKTNFTDSVFFSSTDAQAVLPGPYRFTGGDAGQHLFAGGGFSLRSAGLQRIIVSRGSIADTSAAISVGSAGVSSFTVSAPGGVTAGSPFLLTVSGAVDSYGNAASGLVSVAAVSGGGSSPGGIPPVYSDVTVTSGSGEAYQTLTNAVVTILAGSSGGFSDSTAAIVVAPASLGAIDASGYPSSVVAGQSFPSPANDILVRVYDVYGNLKTNFTDSVFFSSTDAQAVLPGPYRFTGGDAGQHLFAGGGFSLRSAGLQRIIVSRGSIADTSAAIGVGAAQISSFVLTAPPNVTAGTSFILTASAAVDAYGNSASGIITVTDSIGAGNSPDGTQPVLNNIIVDAGWGSSPQTLVRAGNARLKGVAGSVVRGTDEILVRPAALADFEPIIATPQISGSAFSSPAVITAKDGFGNVKTDYDASTDTVVISASTGGPMTNNILRDADDFSLGQADLAALGVTYSGIGGQVFFTASSQSGISDQSNIVDVVSLTADQLSLVNSQVARGDTAYGSVALTNLSALPVVITTISIFDDAGFQFSPIFSPTLPDTVGAGIETTFVFALPITPAVSFGHHPLAMKVTGAYAGRFTSDSLRQFTDTLEVLRASQISYVDSSLSPRMVSAGLAYSFIIRLANAGDAALSLSDTSHLVLGAGQSSVRANLIQPAIISGGSTAEIAFVSTQIPSALAGSRHAVTLKYFGTELGSFVVDSLIHFDSVEVLSAVQLSYINSSLRPDSLLTGTAINFTARFNNSGTAALDLNQALTTISFSDGQSIYSASLDTNPAVRIERITAGDTTLTFRTTALPQQFSPGRYRPTIHIAGVQNSLPFTLDIYPESLEVLTPGALRIDSLYVVSYNAPRVNTNQSFVIAGRISNFGVDPVDSISLLLSSDGSSQFDDTLQFGTLDGLADAPFTFNITASTNPDPAEIFHVAIVNSRSRFTGQSAQILPPLDNSAAVVIESPASLRFDTIYASDESLSTGQVFLLYAVAFNDGSSSYSGSNQIELDFHGDSAFQAVDSTRRDLIFGQAVAWRVRAPLTTRSASAISVVFRGRFVDLNDSTTALAADSIASVVLTVTDFASITHRAKVVSPDGAIDRILSTSQNFTIGDSVFRAGNSGPAFARIYLPDGFSSADPLVQSTAEALINWNLQAPESPTQDSIAVDCWTFDFNTGDSVYDSRIWIPLQIQTRSIINLGLNIVSPPSAMDRIIEPSGYFVIEAMAANLGQAPAGDGTMALDFQSPGFHSSEPLIRQFTPGIPVSWTVTAPDSQILQGTSISVRIVDSPIDSNSNRPAFMIADSTGLSVIIRNEVPNLVLRDIRQPKGAIVKGQPFEILRFRLLNSTLVAAGQIGLTEIRTVLVDENDLPIPSNSLASATITLDGVDFAGVLTDSVIHYDISPPIVIDPDSSLDVSLRLTARRDADFIRLGITLSSDMIKARLIVGEVPEQFVRVVFPDGEDFTIKSPRYILIDPEFAGSLRLNQNPFLASQGPLRIGFNLSEDADLEFLIYDTEGTKVWESKRNFTAGSYYSDENAMEWNGRSSSGERVLSGPYYLFINNLTSGQSAKIKIAVVW